VSDHVLSVQNLRVLFPVKRGAFGRKRNVHAVDGVSFTVREGETLGIVGESGCGKSTLARAVLGLVPLTGGRIIWRGVSLHALDRRGLRDRRREFQMIFQDPLASLDPRMTVADIVAEPLHALRADMRKEDVREAVRHVIKRVGLDKSALPRYPHEFSGGQCQRISIARALAVEPKLLVCDEPVSALDVSVQAQILNLLNDLRASRGLTMLFISHDLSVVRHMSDRVMVLYLGRVMEFGDRDRLLTSPRHPYTRALIEAAPVPDPEVEKRRRITPLSGEVPSPLDPPSGCVFRTRCPKAKEKCTDVVPDLRALGPGHNVACHFPE
jgi:oligopeptide transport system ATP-binding protein